MKIKLSLLILVCFFQEEPSDACTARRDRFSTTITVDTGDYRSGWSHFTETTPDRPLLGLMPRFSVLNRDHKEGCLVFGPYAHTSGPAQIYGTIYFNMQVTGLEPNEVAVRMDLTADHGNKTLAYKDFTQNSLGSSLSPYFVTDIQRGGLMQVSTYYTLTAQTEQALQNIEVRLCTSTGNMRMFSFTGHQSVLTVNYNSEGANVVESNCK